MEPTLRLRSLMDTTTSIFLCLFIFVTRAVIKTWPDGGLPAAYVLCLRNPGLHRRHI